MTASTEQERALADLRHMYAQMVGGMVKDSAQAKRIADGILSRAIQKLEQAARRAPAAPQAAPISDELPQGFISDVLTAAGLVRHGKQCKALADRLGDAIEKIWTTSIAQRKAIAAVPQPPEATVNHSLTVEAAPVELPEPVAKIEGGSLKWHIPDAGYSLPVRYLQGSQMLYTEQQVRQLLAAHGIKEQST